VGKRAKCRLTSLTVKSVKEPGYHLDGDGLYLQVSTSGSKSWIHRYMRNNVQREMGLGSAADVSLAEAREFLRRNRRLLTEGVDPIARRRSDREATLKANLQKRTFEQCALEVHKQNEGSWKNAKHGDQWINTLKTYVFPVFGEMDVSEVSKSDVLKVLGPIWTTKHETASRVKQRIKMVLDWASARDHRLGHDPHLWDQISQSLPKTKLVKKVKHFESCPYRQVHGVLNAIRHSGTSDATANAMEFLILTAARSGEVRGALWSEVDFDQKRWTIPPHRMKANREHRVPLSARAVEILRQQRGNDAIFIFANEKGKQLSDMTLTMVLRRLKYDFKVHGFRSTFRDWCAEQTQFPREVCEAALAHVIKDSTEAAYFRSDVYDKRQQLMDAWSSYCATNSVVADNVQDNQVSSS